MKRINSVIAFLIVFLSVLTVFSESKVVVVSTYARKANEQKLAKSVSRNLSLLFSSLKGAKVVGEADALSSKERKYIDRCKGNSKCIIKVARRASGVDYIIISKLASDRKKGTKIVAYLYDTKGKRLAKQGITGDYDTDSEDLAADMLSAVRTMISSNVGSSSSSSSSSRSSSAKRLSSYTDVKNEIKKGFNSYNSGNIKEAEDVFNRAANEMDCNCNQNAKAKDILRDVSKVSKGMSKVESSLSANDYRTALRVLTELRSADNAVREAGYKSFVYKKIPNVRHKYLMPNAKDARIVDDIHRTFQSKIDAARKWKTRESRKIDAWVNTNIKKREKEIADLREQLKGYQQDLKKAQGDLTKKIQGMKYKWEKDDSSLEQEIVSLESKITMLEQREKGVIKVSNKKREKAKEKELSDVKKQNSQWKKDFKEEKEKYFKAQEAKEKAEADRIATQIKKLEKQKDDLEKKNREVDAEIQKMLDAFDKEERAIMAKNEAVRMKSEDEDRKYNVTVEKEYQKKFDELNKKLAKYDQEESKKAKELDKFDREIEEFMLKSANEMGKIQNDIETKRTKVEAEYAGVKAKAQEKVEKEYDKNLNELATKRAKLEEAIAKHNDETEALKAKTEETLIKANEKEIVAVDQRLGKIESEILAIDQSYELKISQVQEAIAKTLDDEEQEKIKKENTIRAEGEKLVAKLNGIEENIAQEKGRYEEFKMKIENEYAEKNAKIEEKKMTQQNKMIEAAENFKANWGDFVGKQVDKLTAEDNKIRTQIENKRSQIAEVEGKLEQDKMKELTSIDQKLINIEDEYAKKMIKVEEDVAKEAEAVKAKLSSDIQAAAKKDGKIEEDSNKKINSLNAEKEKIVASFDEKMAKHEEEIAKIDEKYQEKKAPYNVDAIVEKMNQAVAELENKKVEEINQHQELLDAISQAKANAEQTIEEQRDTIKNKAELAKLERAHATAMRKIGLDEKSTQRKITFTESSYDRKIKFEKSKYERELSKKRAELKKLEKQKNLELISTNREVNKIEKQKAIAVSKQENKIQAAKAAHKRAMANRANVAKKMIKAAEVKEKITLASVGKRKKNVAAQKAAAIRKLQAQKTNINMKYKGLEAKEKGAINGEIGNLRKKLKGIGVSIKNWERKISKVDPKKLAEVKAPFLKKIGDLKNQTKSNVAEKDKKIAEVTEAHTTVLGKLTSDKALAAKKTQGIDVRIKSEQDAITKKFATVRAKMKADIANLVKEKKGKIFAINKEKGTLLKNRAVLEKGFSGNLKKDLRELSKKRNIEKNKMKKELKAVSIQLAQHEKSHDSFVQKEIDKIDQKYQKQLMELDMMLGSENKRLQDGNKAFTKKKKGEKFAYSKMFKQFLAEKKRFKNGIDKEIQLAQKARDKKIEDRRKERKTQQVKWAQEKKRRQVAFDRKTSGQKRKLDMNSKKISTIMGQTDSINNVGGRKLQDLKANNHKDSKRMEKIWIKKVADQKVAYEKGKKAVIDKYDQMEVKEKQGRDVKKKQMMAKRDKLLVKKEQRKTRRMKVLDREKQNWLKNKDRFEKKIADIQDKIAKKDGAKGALADKDKETAKGKKTDVQKKYESTIEKINEAELKMIKGKFRTIYEKEKVREVQITGTTKKIEAMMAEAYAKSGLNKLEKNDIERARKDFVDALYLDSDSKTAKEGLKAIKTKAQAMYWEAFGAKDSNKSKAVKILQILTKSLLPTNEIYLKSRILLEDLK